MFLLHYHCFGREFKLKFNNTQGLEAHFKAILPDIESGIAYVVFIGGIDE
jgi:hypothetical protein